MSSQMKVGKGIPGVQAGIAVSSGKGGVGKSTVAVNLATALALEGKRVGLIDADIYGPNIPTMMGVTDDAVVDLLEDADGKKVEMILPPLAHGVKVMSMGMLVPEDQPMVWRGPMLHSAIQQFLYRVRWGELDVLVVDMPPGTGDIQLSLAQLVPITAALLVTTPQEVAAQDVRKAFRMFEQANVTVIGFVENMSYFVCDGCDKKHALFGQDGGDRLARKFGVEVLTRLPLVPEAGRAGDEGRPIVKSQPDSELAKLFRELAKKVDQRVVAELLKPAPAESSLNP